MTQSEMRKIIENVLNLSPPPSSPPTVHLLIIRKVRQITANEANNTTLNPRDLAGTKTPSYPSSLPKRSV